MKRKLFSVALFVILLGFSGLSQGAVTKVPLYQFEHYKSTPTLHLLPPDMEVIHQEDEERDRNGQLYRIGVAAYTNITTASTGNWTTKTNGDRIWQLHIRFPGAEALSFLFTTFKIYGNARFDVYDTSGKPVTETLTAADVNHEHFQQHIALCFGDEMTLQLTEPSGNQESEILIDRIFYDYRSTGNPSIAKINESASCQVNVNCSPVGDTWKDEKRGVARILVVDQGSQGYCSGSLVNNTAQDCKPLFLTAQHCGVTASTADFNQWKFYFAYEAPTCANPTSATGLLSSTKRIDGSMLLASSAGVSGNNITSSDFILVQLGTPATEANVINKLRSAAINAYWNGWDANNVAATGGAGIHQPAGDIKKISTYSGTLVSTQYSFGGNNTHWRVIWTANANGHGVTQGGSSGSPIFNTNGGNSRIIGTLSGGSSFCTALSSPDLYGKFSYHWVSNGTAAANRQVKPYLDPGNTGALVMNGSSNPCIAGAPVAEFVGSPTTVVVGGIVQFTDQSTNSPTNWSWSISPATGWNYVASTTANSQNPQVTFSAQGQYTISLTASNTQGSDDEVKTNYITVTVITAPCTATSSTCDEFINNVALGSINNTSACNMYSNFTNLSTALTKGQQYTITITPQIGVNIGSAYPGDEIAAWIDWNGDFDFEDTGERIAYVLVTTGWNNAFTFTVPQSAMLGQVNMRVRISFNGSPNPDGPITPCGQTQFGEVEDYTVAITDFTSMDELSAFTDVSIFPNPTSGQLSVDLSGITGNVQVELVDITGKILAVQQNVAGTTAQFNLSGYAKGLYQVRMTNGIVHSTRKVVKL